MRIVLFILVLLAICADGWAVNVIAPSARLKLADVDVVLGSVQGNQAGTLVLVVDQHLKLSEGNTATSQGEVIALSLDPNWALQLAPGTPLIVGYTRFFRDLNNPNRGITKAGAGPRVLAEPGIMPAIVVSTPELIRYLKEEGDAGQRALSKASLAQLQVWLADADPALVDFAVAELILRNQPLSSALRAKLISLVHDADVSSDSRMMIFKMAYLGGCGFTKNDGLVMARTLLKNLPIRQEASIGLAGAALEYLHQDKQTSATLIMRWLHSPYGGLVEKAVMQCQQRAPERCRQEAQRIVKKTLLPADARQALNRLTK